MNHDLDIKTQVKHILKIVQELAPGKTVELRIPPYAVTQCMEGGKHRRGTPPNVVEMKAETLISLVGSPDQWQQFCHSGAISASGTNSNLGKIFEVVSNIAQERQGEENGK